MVSPSLEVLFRLDWSMRATLEDWEGHLETKGSRPYWRYTALIDNHTHHMHKVWHGLILPADHPWWRVHYPPNGRNCRCKVMSVSEDDLRHDGWVVSPEPPQDIMTSYLHPITGKELFTPEGIEPGWDCCPGDWSNRLDSPAEISAHHLASCLLSLEKKRMMKTKNSGLRILDMEDCASHHPARPPARTKTATAWTDERA